MAFLSAAAVVLQAPALQPQLERIATAQIVMAAGTALATLAVLAMAIATFVLIRSVRRMAGRIEGQLQAMLPKVEPLLGAAGKVAADATDVSGAIKTRADEVLTTVGQLNERLHELATETEERVREFGAVLDVVQAEAREILLDATATARGVHATAEALQPGRRNPARRRS
jgi:hypothetical protein